MSVGCFVGLCRPWNRRTARRERRISAPHQDCASTPRNGPAWTPRRCVTSYGRYAPSRPASAHPWAAAAAVVVVGRGPVIAVQAAAGWAVRYASYDERPTPGWNSRPRRASRRRRRTPFDLASLTKLFTAVVAVQQLERGALSIDARVAAYLPDFARRAQHHITVRQLLTHTSGLRPELPLYDCPDDAARRAMLRAEAPRPRRASTATPT